MGEEALGGSDADLRPGVGVDHRVRLARDGGPVGVADRQHPGALLAGVPDGHQGVCGLPGLADGHDQGGRPDDRIAVAELAGQFHLARDPGPVLDRVLGHQAGVEGGAAGDHHDLVHTAQLGFGDADLVQGEPVLLVAAPEERVGDRAGLLVDLLAHEPVVATLLRRREVPVHVVGADRGRLAVEGGDLHRLAGDPHDLVLAELDRVPGVLDEGGDVGGEEVLPLADPDHQRGVAPGGHHGLRVLAVHRDQGEGPVEAAAHRAHRLHQRQTRAHLLAQQLGHDLGVGLGDHGDAGLLELGAQGGVVLHDPVVHQRDPPVGRDVRVGVDVVRRTVGGPAGVPDAQPRTRQRRLDELLLEVAELAGLLGQMHPGLRRGRPILGAPRGPAGRRPRWRPRPSRTRGTPAGAAPGRRRPGRPEGRRSPRFRTWR